MFFLLTEIMYWISTLMAVITAWDLKKIQHNVFNKCDQKNNENLTLNTRKGTINVSKYIIESYIHVCIHVLLFLMYCDAYHMANSVKRYLLHTGNLYHLIHTKGYNAAFREAHKCLCTSSCWPINQWTISKWL